MAFRATRSNKIKLLRAVRLFSACNDRELGRIASLVDEIKVEAGRVLTKEGAAGGEAFVIAEGRATATLRKKKLGSLGPGSLFGEMSLLDHGPRAATITADTPMHLLVLDPRSFVSLLDDVPSVARKILRVLAERLREVEKAPTN
ncbi:MAG TPA: cyclic nucleotide-binding domain-containing protein [Acidimicrobiales bacterium]|nr:cyclic nucleotide-binding domain-containing protein [Acidimicrobiales bacterium]